MTLTVAQAAEYLGCNIHTVYRHLCAGDLPGNRIGRVWRIRKEDLDNYLAGNFNN